MHVQDIKCMNWITFPNDLTPFDKTKNTTAHDTNSTIAMCGSMRPKFPIPSLKFNTLRLNKNYRIIKC